MSDISIVLNIHRGSKYLIPSLISLDRSINYAQNRDLNIELVVVFDNSDEKTYYNFNNFNFNSLFSIKILKVSNGSLSLSRNSGIEIATGKYIFTYDEDDLISENAIFELHRAAISNGEDHNSAYFLNFLIAFGEDYYVAEFIESDFLTPLDFIANNVYTSRIFVNKKLLLKYMYRSILPDSGFAFEDWDLINRMQVDGIEFKIAKDTILFYRIQTNGMLRTSLSNGNDLPPRSYLHSTDYLVKKNVSNSEKTDFIYQPKPIESELLSQRILNDALLNALVLDAIEIDPTILYKKIRESKDYSPLPIGEEHWASAYLTSLKFICDFNFTDVVIFPFLNPGGGEKYILQVLNSIEVLNTDAKILVLTIEDTEKNLWKSKLSSNSRFLDLRNTFPNLSDESLEFLLVNLLLLVDKENPRLHLKTSYFGEKFLVKFQKVLSQKFTILYYRFSDSVYQLFDREFKDHNTISFLRDSLEFIDHVLTDNLKIVESDRKQFGDFYTRKYTLIETYVDENIEHWIPKNPTYRLIWASRISLEKRPYVLPIIIEALQEHIPEIKIDVFGALDLPDFLPVINNFTGLNYKGEFEGFSSLPINEYDLFLYTSKFDGTPNVLIEAMSCGVPIIAPDVGGISGIFPKGHELIQNIANDEALAKLYVERIIAAYSNWSTIVKQAKLLRELAHSRFSEKRHQADIKNLLMSSSKNDI